MKYVILGAGAAGLNAVKGIRERNKEAEITVVSPEKEIYSRCLLPLVINGRRSSEELNFLEDNFFDTYRTAWWNGERVTQIDTEQQTVQLSRGDLLDYDRLLIATGSSAVIPPVEGLREGKNVFSLRTLQDAKNLSVQALRAKRTVVMGGGLVGVEAAVKLKEIQPNMEVVLVEMLDTILSQQLDEVASEEYSKRLERRGIRVRTSVRAEKGLLDGDGNLHCLHLSDGTHLPCDLVVCAAGVRPNTNFLDVKVFSIERTGITVDEYCATNVEGVFAAGDVTGVCPIWPTAVKMGRVAGRNMVNRDHPLEPGELLSRNSINLLGLKTISLGTSLPPDNSYTTVSYKWGDNYQKLVLQDYVIQGAILQGDLTGAGAIAYLIENHIDLSHISQHPLEVGYKDFFCVNEKGEYCYQLS